MRSNQKYTLCRDIQWQAVENEVIILNMASGDYFSLNDTGAEIFLGIIKGALPASLALRQNKRGSIDEAELEKDVKDLLCDLVKNGIIKKAA